MSSLLVQSDQEANTQLTPPIPADTPFKYNKSFARRLSRGLTPEDKRLFSTLMPQFSITPESIHHLQTNHYTSLNFELGFGGGEHLSSLAQRHPDQLFIGCEPYLNGVSHLLRDIDTLRLSNILVNTGDGRLLLERMPEASLNTVYILFADPWPKRRHHKRRVINHEFLTIIASKLKPGGQLVLATDHSGYANWIERHLSLTPSLHTTLSDQAIYSTTPPPDWVTTRYEQKAKNQGSTIRYYRLTPAIIERE